MLSLPLVCVVISHYEDTLLKRFGYFRFLFNAVKQICFIKVSNGFY
ncbi:hypothetical protein Sps_04017 [Shewanella psychrophila]|uniref:Uncharacterized protein n=1 Tax=Shewanella psychrophila TaxID=225848 RepID=A0A1S6HUA0_9GAMM|nr:hypothetical protein Sps_04010 [Shewanella psychrophila]AQS39132.1 hypothetical protein Sps_04017 [Shewanella psychrophila]